jgi:hypothetical protein
LFSAIGSSRERSSQSHERFDPDRQAGMLGDLAHAE